MFDAVEKDTLRPLPAEPFVLATWATAKIGPDIHAQVDKVLYSVPWRHIGKTADVRLTATMVQFFIGGELVKSHPRKVRGKQTDFADYPPEKIAFHMRTPQWCRKQAAGIGPACEQVIGELLAGNALYRLRAAQGVIGLADKHDPAGSRPPARRRSRPATHPTGQCGASSPPAPSGTSCPPRPGTAGRPPSCAAPPRSRTLSPCPARSPATPSRGEPGQGDAVTPSAASGAGPVAGHVRLIRAAADLIEQAGIRAWRSSPTRTRSSSRSPGRVATRQPASGQCPGSPP